MYFALLLDFDTWRWAIIFTNRPLYFRERIPASVE